MGGVVLLDSGSFLNHSCKPNALLRFTDSGVATITALKNISCDEEILIDYCSANKRGMCVEDVSPSPSQSSPVATLEASVTNIDTSSSSNEIVTTKYSCSNNSNSNNSNSNNGSSSCASISMDGKELSCKDKLSYLESKFQIKCKFCDQKKKS
jgi:hypothetical protein